jgi:hypothetical protein
MMASSPTQPYHTLSQSNTTKPTITLISGSEQPNHSETTTFPVSRLPPELRHKIYTHYFTTLPPFSITQASNPPLISTIQLSLASPYLYYDIPPRLFYQNTIFSFSCPQILQSFPSKSSAFVKRVNIEYGDISKRGPDWVYLCVVVNGEGEAVFEGWWRCVRDAVREAGGNGVVVRAESRDGEWSVWGSNSTKRKK